MSNLFLGEEQFSQLMRKLPAHGLGPLPNKAWFVAPKEGGPKRIVDFQLVYQGKYVVNCEYTNLEGNLEFFVIGEFKSGRIRLDTTASELAAREQLNQSIKVRLERILE